MGIKVHLTLSPNTALERQIRTIPIRIKIHVKNQNQGLKDKIAPIDSVIVPDFISLFIQFRIRAFLILPYSRPHL